LRKTLVALLAAIIILCIIEITFINFSQGESKTLSMAIEFNDHAAAAWVALDRKMFEEEQLNLAHFETFQTGLELAAAMSRGDVEVGWVCLGPAILIHSSGVPVKVISGTHLHGYAIVSKPEIRDVKELDGKLVGCPGKGSPCYLVLRMAMEKYGFEPVIKKIKPYAALNALLTGQLDAVALPEHYVTLAKLRGGCNVLVRSQDLWPEMPGSVLVVREKVLKEKPEAVKRLVDATVKATGFIREHPREAAKIVAEKLGIKIEEAEESMGYLEYSNELSLKQVQRYIDLMAKYGCIERSFPAEELVDLSYLR